MDGGHDTVVQASSTRFGDTYFPETHRFRHGKEDPGRTAGMVSVVGAIGVLFIVAVNTAVAALATRFLRVRMATQWGTAVYVALLVPVLEVIVTLVLSGVVGLGSNLGGPVAVLGVTVLLPLSLGVAFDFFWMPAPDDVELPDTL